MLNKIIPCLNRPTWFFVVSQKLPLDYVPCQICPVHISCFLLRSTLILSSSVQHRSSKWSFHPGLSNQNFMWVSQLNSSKGRLKYWIVQLLIMSGFALHLSPVTCLYTLSDWKIKFYSRKPKLKYKLLSCYCDFNRFWTRLILCQLNCVLNGTRCALNTSAKWQWQIFSVLLRGHASLNVVWIWSLQNAEEPLLIMPRNTVSWSWLIHQKMYSKTTFLIA